MYGAPDRRVHVGQTKGCLRARSQAPSTPYHVVLRGNLPYASLLAMQRHNQDFSSGIRRARTFSFGATWSTAKVLHWRKQVYLENGKCIMRVLHNANIFFCAGIKYRSHFRERHGHQRNLSVLLIDVCMLTRGGGGQDQGQDQNWEGHGFSVTTPMV